MLLRELTKESTETSYQSKISSSSNAIALRNHSSSNRDESKEGESINGDDQVKKKTKLV
jgi:hypothetical protein